MPQIIIKGMPLDTLKSISTELIQNLSQIMNCPSDYFLLEYIEAHYIGCTSYPLIEIKWFDRGQDIKKKTALYITETLSKMAYENIEVYFTPLQPLDYFENGAQLG